MRYGIAALLFALVLIAPLRTSSARPMPTPTPTALPAPAPFLSVAWLRSGLARASWIGYGCLVRYGVRGDRLIVGCAPDTLDTPAEMGDTFRLVVNGDGEATISARVGICGVSLLPIVR